MKHITTQDQLVIRLESCGNPDYGQYAPISNPLNLIVDTIESAQQAVREYIAFWNLGGGNWSGGQIYQNGILIGKIQYNGRFLKQPVKRTYYGEEAIILTREDCVAAKETARKLKTGEISLDSIFVSAP